MREHFSSLYGNERTKKRLFASITGATLPHALLIAGPLGSGKKTLALEISAALNCENREKGELPLPCGVCNTCRRIKDGNFTDIMHLSRKDGKATLGVEEIRLFREDMFLSPNESTNKIYIIDEADKLTPNAQNALLTVLEEPPKNVYIMLLADSTDKILTTVKSRAQLIATERFSQSDLRKFLTSGLAPMQARSKSGGELDEIIMSSDGRIGRLLLLLGDKAGRENLEDRLLTERIVNALHPSVPYSELYSVLSELPGGRAEFKTAIEDVICALRDIILTKLNSNVTLLFYPSVSKVREAGRDMNTKRILAICELLTSALQDAEGNVSISTIVADMGARIKLM